MTHLLFLVNPCDLQVTEQEIPNWLLLVNGNMHMVVAVDTTYHDTQTRVHREFNQYEDCYTTNTCTQTSAAFEVLDGEIFELVSLGEEGGERFP